MGELTELSRSRAVTGWRYWELGGTAPAWLRSLSQRSFAWPPGQVMVARCREGRRPLGQASGDDYDHEAPGERCGCGIHANAGLASLHAQALCVRSVPLVVGEVALWGRVITEERADGHGQDHRGQYAYPLRVAVVSETLEEMDETAAMDALGAYRVPVEAISLEEAVGEASLTMLRFLRMSAPAP